jgi:hypothetical protein
MTSTAGKWSRSCQQFSVVCRRRARIRGGNSLRSLDEQREWHSELSYGGGGVNLVNVHLFVETMPFGGTGSTGMGHYYGKYGFDALSHAKSMLISPPDVAIDHLYSPFDDAKNQALKCWFEY